MVVPTSFAQQAGSGNATGRLLLPEAKMAGLCTTMVTPHYPPGTLAEEQKPALVVLRVGIDSSGHVAPINSASGPEQLVSAAKDVVRLWRYHPYQRDGSPVDVVTEVRVAFIPGAPGGLITHPNR